MRLVRQHQAHGQRSLQTNLPRCRVTLIPQSLLIVEDALRYSYVQSCVIIVRRIMLFGLLAVIGIFIVVLSTLFPNRFKSLSQWEENDQARHRNWS